MSHRVCTQWCSLCYFTLCCSFLYRSLCKPKLNCLLYCLQDYKWLFVQRFRGQRSNANRLETPSLCVQAWLCKADRRLLCRAKKSENSVVLTPVCIARAVAIGFGLVWLVASAGHAPTKNIWNIGAMRLLLRPSLVQYNASRDPGPRVRSRVQCLCWGWLESMLIEMRRWGDRALNRHWRTALPSWRSSSE